MVKNKRIESIPNPYSSDESESDDERKDKS